MRGGTRRIVVVPAIGEGKYFRHLLSTVQDAFESAGGPQGLEAEEKGCGVHLILLFGGAAAPTDFHFDFVGWTLGSLWQKSEPIAEAQIN